MSQTIDSKVVEMQFDNKQFERNVDSTIKSIDKLEKSLDISGAAKGIDNIESKFRGLDFSSLADGVETVKSKFSVLETIAVGALLNIGSQAEQMAVNLVKSMSAIDGMTAGWQKYNEKTASVQTIMAATGKSIDEVDEQLSKLMWYTDETSYDFVDMTNNIGKFTSAGVSLEDATSAMMGISNWAALSGANIQQASHAMYNLSQALGTGSVKLIDWKSIENANMATVEFKQQVIDTAKAMGTLSDDIGVTATNFDQYLNQKDFGVWFTSDVLIEVLKKYGEYAEAVYQVSDAYDTCSEAMKHVSDEGMELSSKAFRVAQEAKTFEEAINSVKDAVSSKWMQTFELMFGNYIEAKKLWTDLANSLYDLFALGGDARNEMLQVWKDNGGQKAFIKSIWNIYDAIILVKDTIAGAFRDIFPPMTGEQLAKLTKQFKNFTATFKMSDETADKLRRTFKGLFAILDIGKQAVSAILSGIKLLIPTNSGLNFSILDITAAIGDWIVKLDEFLKKHDVFKRGIEAVINVLKSIPKVVDDIFKKITGKDLGETFDISKNSAVNALNKINEVTGGLEGIADKISKLPDIFKSAVAKVKTVPTVISKGFEALTNMSAGEVFSSLQSKAESALKSVRDTFEGFKKTDTSGIDSLTKSVEQKTSPLEKAMNKLKSIFEPIATFFKKVTATFKKVFNIVKKVFDPIISYFSHLGGMFKNAFQEFGKALNDAFDGDIGIDEVLDIFNGGVLALITLTIKDFIDNMSKLGKDLGGVTGGFKDIISNSNRVLDGVTKVLGGVQESLEAWQQNLKAKTLMTLASAIAVISAALIVLSMVNPEKLKNALTIITAEFVELMSSFSIMAKTSEGKSAKAMEAASKNLLMMSVAILVLSMAMKSLAKLDPKDLVRTTATVTALIFALSTAAVMMSARDGESMIKGASGLIAMAIAIRLLMKPVAELGSLSLDTLIAGLGGVTELILVLSGSAVILSKNSKGLVEAGIGLIAIATAIRILSSSVEKLGKMDSNDLVSGLLAVTELVVAMSVMSVVMSDNTDGLVKGGVGLIAIAAALRILVNSVKNLGNMDAVELVSGLAAVTALLTAMTVVAVVMSENTDGLVKGGAGLIAIATALRILVNSVITLGNMDPTEMVNGLLAVTALLVELTAVAVILSGNTSGLVQAGIGLAAISVGMLIIANALTSLAGQDIEGLLQAVITLGATLAILAVALKVMQSEMKGAATLLIISVALMALVPPIVALSNLSWKKLTNGLKGLAIMLGVLLAAGLLAGFVAPGLLALSAALLALGLSIASIGGGILMAAEGFALLAEMGESGGESAKKALTEIISIIPTFVKAVGSAIIGVGKQILDAIPQILEDVKNIAIQILLLIDEVAPLIVKTVIDLLGAIGAAIEPKIPDIVEFCFQIVMAVLRGFEEHAEEIAFLGVSIITNLLEGFARKLPDLIQAGFDVILAFITGLGQAIKDNAKALREAINTLVSDILDAICEFLGIHSPSTKFKEIAGNMIDGLIEGFKDFVGGAVDAIKGVMEKIIDKVKSFFSKIKKKGGEIIGKIVEGVTSSASNLYQNVSSVISKVVDNIKKKLKSFFTKGKEIVTNIIDGISNVAQDLWDAFTDLISDAVETVKGFFSKFAEIGGYLIDGLIDGIKGAAQDVVDAAKDLGNDIIDSVKGIFDSHSPSRVFMQIGNDLDEGLIIGIKDLSKDVTNAATNMGEDAIDGIASATSRIADIINSDPNFNPVITPVVDLSNVVAGSNAIDDMFSASQTLALAGSTNTQMNKQLSANLDGNKITVNNKDVVDEIRSLREEMNDMSSAIQSMRIVMDTGSLVGAIAGPIDRNLGRRVVIKGRGV